MCFLCFQLNRWPRSVSAKFQYTIYPISFSVGNADEWKKLFKPCAAQRLFLPVRLQNISPLTSPPCVMSLTSVKQKMAWIHFTTQTAFFRALISFRSNCLCDHWWFHTFLPALIEQISSLQRRNSVISLSEGRDFLLIFCSLFTM